MLFRSVKIKFLTTLPSGNAPTSTSSVIIDEVAFLKFATINRVSTPVITPESGNISDSTEVTITCATEGASIYYTTDGSLPTSASTLYSAPFYIPAASATVQAIAIMEDVMDSEVARAEYVYVAANQVVAPVITPEGGTFTGDVYVKITCATEGARIYYTLDGTTPDTTSSTLYTDSIMLLNTTTVKAIAAKTDMENSEVATETYTLPVTINVDDIAGFYSVSAAAPTDSIDYYRITDAVTAVYQQGQNLYIHDASGWLLIYGAQDSTFVNGDLLQGVKGKHGLYQGCAQMTYAILPEATQGVAVAPVEKLIGGLAIADNYMYVKLTGVSFTTAANYTTGSTTNGTVSDGSNTITIRNNFRVINASYAIGDRVDIEGFVSVYNNAVQIYPISITDNPLTVETPVISPDGGDIAVATQVSITCATEDAIIYYTIDGTTPTTASAVYSAPFSVSETTTVSAMATKTSMTASAVATQTYTWVGIDTVATPVITPESGNILSGAAVTITCATEGATIYYTLDGTTPTETSAIYTAPLTIVYNTTVKAYAVNAGMADSEMAEATYTIVTSLVDEPVISPVGGNVTDTVTVTITCATAGAKIYYTIDGTTPDTLTATEYTAAFTVGETTTVKAIAAKAGMTTSNVVTETYTFPVPVVEEPVISPVGGNVTAPVTVTITCATAGAKIYYTTDGTAPDTLTATEYTAAFTVSATATVKAIAAKAGMTTSAVVEETYTFPMEVVETPVITPAGGNVTAATQVTITCATADAKIYYTIDGTTPDTLSSTLYTGAITVSVTTTVKAIAAKAGMTTSDIATETYTFPATTEVTDIAAFYAAGAAGTSGAKYTITGAVNVVYQNYMSLYVQDASGWLLIYGSFNGDSYTNGQLLEGVQGEYTTYQGYGQMINFTLPDATQGATVSPVIKQVADIVNDDVYMYVQLSGVYFTENVTFNTSSTTSGTVQQNGSQIGIRNNFRVIDATFTPAEELMIEGFVSVFSGTAQIYPTAISALSSVNTVELQPIYVSQGAIYVPANVGDQIEVYTVTGQCLVILKAEQALTVINDMPKDQILMVRVANKTSKVVVR